MAIENYARNQAQDALPLPWILQHASLAAGGRKCHQLVIKRVTLWLFNVSIRVRTKFELTAVRWEIIAPTEWDPNGRTRAVVKGWL